MCVHNSNTNIRQFILQHHHCYKHSSKGGDISKFEFCDDFFVRFYGGRVDCPTSPWSNNLWEFPSALGDNEHIVDFFKNQFDFDEKETAAILGMYCTVVVTLTQSLGSYLDYDFNIRF